MPRRRLVVPPALGAVVLAGCATRPVGARIAEVDRQGGYRFPTRQDHDEDSSTLVVLAFSGIGTRAAAGRIVEPTPEFQRLPRDRKVEKAAALVSSRASNGRNPIMTPSAAAGGRP